MTTSLTRNPRRQESTRAEKDFSTEFNSTPHRWGLPKSLAYRFHARVS